MSFAEYLREGVLAPLGMADTSLDGSPAAGATSTAADLSRFAAELQNPSLLAPATLQEATRLAYPGLSGVLPGFGRQQDNDWGLGFEIRNHKEPHWTGANSSPNTFGHFGQSGTFLWVDPEAGAACVALTDRAFGPWAAEVWPKYTDAVLAELERSPGFYQRPLRGRGWQTGQVSGGTVHEVSRRISGGQFAQRQQRGQFTLAAVGVEGPVDK